MVKYGKLPLHNSELVIAVGDIHGEADKLEGLLAQVKPILLEDTKCHLVFCGDYINRGPNSARVLDILIKLKEELPEQVYYVMGNHEAMFIGNLKDDINYLNITDDTFIDIADYWGLPNARLETVARACLDNGVADFLDNLLPYYESDRVICTHAPIDRITSKMFGLGDSKLEDLCEVEPTENFILDAMGYELMWLSSTEDPKLSRIPEIEKFLFCGHQFRHHKAPRLFRNRAFIDTGCGYGDSKPLTAVMFPGKKVFQQG